MPFVVRALVLILGAVVLAVGAGLLAGDYSETITITVSPI